MNAVFYLARVRNSYFYRRRVPRISTKKRPVMLSLGTTDRKQALKSCAKLTAHMDWMLDNDLHMTLPEGDVAAFFKAELRHVLHGLKVVRTVEHVNGTMTSEKALHNRLNMIVLAAMAEKGLRQDIPPSTLSALEPHLRDQASKIHEKIYAEFTSDEYNNAIQQRATGTLKRSEFTDCDKLFLRKAALDARMAAYSAYDAAPLHDSEKARAAAIEMLMESSAAAASGQSDPDTDQTRASLAAAPPQDFHRLTDGVDLIKGRITAQTIYAQRDQALKQPHDETFDGDAGNVTTEKVYGNDLFDTAVRMIRKSRSQEDTGQQKLKSVALFIYLTGVQTVTDIRQHHLDLFGQALEKQLPKYYWKSDAQKTLTFKELLEINRNRPDEEIGLASPTIGRHLTTIITIMRYADREGNKARFIPQTAGLVPTDERADDQKRSVFTPADARKLFQHSLWQGCRGKGRRHTAGNIAIKDHHYWINLLLAYTGARRAEIAGLLETEVSCVDGIHFVNIKKNFLRGLKTPFSRRRIPLHPHLIELGFLDFVGSKRKANERVLFPEAIPAKTRAQSLQVSTNPPGYDPKFGDSLDHVWRECLTRSLNGNPEKYCVGSLRSYVNDTLINLRKEDGNTLTVPDIDRRDIMGHKPIDVNVGNYRRHEKPLRPLYVAICLLPRLF